MQTGGWRLQRMLLQPMEVIQTAVFEEVEKKEG
jgi:hypothetical protein